jgi:hypothetical protein
LTDTRGKQGKTEEPARSAARRRSPIPAQRDPAAPPGTPAHNLF